MRDQLIHILAQALANNIGQRLTSELATGIATVVSQALVEAEKQAGDVDSDR